METATRDHRHIVVGGTLIIAGIGFLAGQLGWVLFTIRPQHWPLILVFLGLMRLVLPATDGRRNYRGGIWLLSIGGWGLVSEFGLFGLHYGRSWPLLIVAVGLNMVLQSFEGARQRVPLREN